ncbi:hypothetical protein SD1617_3162 [Shigella dysenteriae 1617]|uniref:Integrase catalytic domain-containing protein n=3 Tax=Shigella dysenteriae TaxID=622 RepID=Q32HW8_SHIDS|nr:hypothetical protein SDY_0911 [Shigella dysenteriae Sd197]EFP70848.1 hypothetical protein SD1617_3162 [Shigella dysenteriae 1617]SPZ80753.1 IS600 ORF2 [Shigella dysenteriae]
MAVTAAKSVMAFRVLTMAVDLCRLTTRTMNVNAGHERTSKARIIHQIQLIRGITKNESLSHYRFNNRDEAISVIREYIEIFYNRQRRHSRLGNISPAAFREKYHQMAA